jgi:membrane-associated protein
MVNLLDAGSVLSAYGWVGILIVMFAETGLLIGFFLPGDTLLFTAGLLCTSAGASAHTKLSLPLVLFAAVFGALAGAQTGFVIGQRGGRALLARTSNKHLHKGLARAEEILAKYGHAKAIVIARFVPVVRTVLNPLAGAAGVPARTFAVWQVIGGTVWSVGLVLGGYLLGKSIPNVDKYLLPIVFVILVLSLIPICLELLRARKEGKGDKPHPYPQSPQHSLDQPYPQTPQHSRDQAYSQSPQYSRDQAYSQSPQQSRDQAYPQRPQQSRDQAYSQRPQQSWDQPQPGRHQRGSQVGGGGGGQYADGSEGDRARYASDVRNAEGTYAPNPRTSPAPDPRTSPAPDPRTSPAPNPRTSPAPGNAVPPQGGAGWRGGAGQGGRPGSVRPEGPQWPTPPHRADDLRQ